MIELKLELLVLLPVAVVSAVVEFGEVRVGRVCRGLSGLGGRDSELLSFSKSLTSSSSKKLSGNQPITVYIQSCCA